MEKIRKDYVGNVYKGRKVHGLKRDINKSGDSTQLPTLSSFCYYRFGWDAPKESSSNSRELAKIAERITCKRCRSILGLSNTKTGRIFDLSVEPALAPKKDNIAVGNSDNDIHPVRFTNKQMGLIKHIMNEFSDYFEEEEEEFFKHIEEAEKEGEKS